MLDRSEFSSQFSYFFVNICSFFVTCYVNQNEIAHMPLLLLQLIHASYNITTNERINRKRYDYLKDGKGRFYNPYNKGVARNLMEFMHMKKPPRDEEVELLGIDIVWWLCDWWCNFLDCVPVVRKGICKCKILLYWWLTYGRKHSLNWKQQQTV